jgi:hypothetical protein
MLQDNHLRRPGAKLFHVSQSPDPREVKLSLHALHTFHAGCGQPDAEHNGIRDATQATACLWLDLHWLAGPGAPVNNLVNNV